MTSDDKHTQLSDRFDLEQRILCCWGITEDIDLIVYLSGLKKNS